MKFSLKKYADKTGTGGSSIKFVIFAILLLLFVQGHSQNTLDYAGLSINTGTGGAAYSFRKLSSAYAGNAIRVRRSSDNTTLDIGFNAGRYLDTVALKTFVGSGNGFITIWYDQSGNGQNAVQATTTQQPKIMNAGALYYYNQLPTASYFGFSGGDNYLATPTLTHGSGTVVYQSSDVFTSPVTLVQAASETNLAFPYVFQGAYIYYSSLWANSVVYNAGGLNDPNTNAASGKMSVISGRQATPASIVNKVARIGGYYFPALGPHPLQGFISEYIVFQTAIPTTTLTALERNTETYFTAPPLTSATSLTTCSGQPVSYTATTTTERTADITGFAWLRPVVAGISNSAGSGSGGSISTINETLVNTTTTAVAVTYTLSMTVLQGTFPKTVTVTVNPSPIIQSQALGASCSVSSFSFTPTGTIPTGTTYSWNAPTITSGNFTGGASGTNLTSISGTLSNLGVTSATALYAITATAGSCSSTFTSTVGIDPPFSVGTQTFTTGCSNNSFVFTPTGTLPNNVTYSWAAPLTLSGSFTGGQGKTNQPNLNGTLINLPAVSTASTMYTITATGGACSSVFSATVTVNPNETISSQVITETCSGNNFLLTPASQLANTRFSWSAPAATSGSFTGGQGQSGQTNISGTLVNLTTSAGTALYTVTATTSAGCTSSFTNTIQIDPYAIIAPQIITPTCGGSAFVFTPTNVPANTLYSWNAPATVSGSFTAGQSRNSQASLFGALSNPGTVSATALYTVTATTTAGCSNSFTGTVTVYADIINNTYSTTTPSIGFGVTPADIIGSTPAGGGDSYTYLWRMSTDGTAYTNASGINNGINYSPGALTQSTWYKRQVFGSTCSNIPAAGYKITVYPVLTISTQPTTTQTICNSTTVNITTAGSGGSLSYTYQWYSNTSSTNTGGTSLPGAASSSYTVPASAVAGNRYYYAVITDFVSGVTATSNAATVITRSALAVNTQPVSSQTVINNTTAGISTSGTGSTGSYSYQWYSNTINSNSGGSVIGGATSASYTVPATATGGTRYFYAVIADAATCAGSVTTNVTAVITSNTLAVSTLPVSPQTVCNNTSTVVSLVAAGGSSSYSYQWYSNASNSNTGGSLIGGATAAGYTVPGTTTTGDRYFYGVVTDVTLGNTVTSNAVKVTTRSGTPVSFSSQPASNTPICINGSVSLQITATGGSSGTFAYQWYSNTSASNTGGVAINSETNASLPKQLSAEGTYYFYATASDPVCGTPIASNVATVQVNALPVISITNNTQTVCQNTPASVAASSFTGGAGTTTYQWFSNAANTTSGGTNLGSANGAQTASLTPSTTNAATTYYYVQASFTGSGCGVATSNNTHKAIVNYTAQPGDIAVTPSNLILCAGLPATLHASLSNSSTIANPVFTWYSDAALSTLANNGGDFVTGVLNTNTTYYVKVSGSNACENLAGNGSVQTITVTAASHAPVVTQPADIASCAGSVTSAVVFASSELNTTYTWSNDNTTVGLSANGNGDIASFTGVNSQIENSVARISVSPFANGCAGLTKSFTITIRPVFTVAGISFSVCSSGTVNYTAPNVPTGTKYSWTTVTVPSGITGAANSAGFQSSFSQTLINTTNIAKQVVYSVTPDGCSTGSFTVTITVNPVPQLGNQTLTGAICSGSGFTYTPTAGLIPSGTLYTWSTPVASPLGSVTGGNSQVTGQSSITESVLNNGLAAVSNIIYTVSPHGSAALGACAGPAFTLTIPVNPKPLLTASSGGTICNNGVASFVPASSTTGVVFTWRRDVNANISNAAATGTNGFSESLNNTSTFPVLVNYIYTLTANGCSNDQTVQVIVNPDPVLNSATDISICSGSIFNYNPSSLSNGTSFAWSRPVITGIRNAANAGNNDVFEALVNTTNAPIVVTYHFTLGYGGCSHSQDVLVTVNPIPSMLETADQVVCNGSAVQVNFSGSSIPNTIYNWTNNNSSIGLSSSGNGNLSFTTVNQQTLVQSGIITILPVAGGCSGTAKSFTVLVNPTPALSSTLTPPSVCGNASFNYTPQSSTPGTSFRWTRAAVTGIDNPAATGSGVIGETLRNSSNGAIPVIYIYTLTANGCVSTRTVTVVVAPIPVITNPGNQVVCSNSLSIVNFSGSIISNTVYGWVNDNASLGLGSSGTGDLFFNAVNTTAAPITGNIKVTPEASGCKGNPQSFTVTINPTLALKSSLAPAAICSNSNFYYLPEVADTSSIVSVSWSRPAVYGLSNKPSFGSKVINDTLINATGSPVSVTYLFTLKNKYCSNTQNVVVQVNPSITIANVQSGINVCSGDQFVFSPLSGATGIQYQWTRDTVTGVSNTASSGTGDINEVLSNTMEAPVDVIYKYRLSIGVSCNSDQVLKVTVKPTPKLVSSTNFVSCSNSLISYVPLSNLQGTNFTWSRSATSGISNGASYGFGTINENLLNTTSSQANVNYTVNLADINGCTSVVGVSVGVNPLPTVSFVTDQSVCAGNSTKLLHFTGGLPGTSFAWTNSEPGIGLAASGTNDIPDFIAANTTGGALAATIQATASLNGCSGNTITVARINVNQPVNSNFIETYPAIACPGQPVGPLVSSVPLGGDGFSYSFQWQLSTDNISFTNVTGSGSGSRKSTAPAQAKDSWYRMMVISGGCSSLSASVKVPMGQKPVITVSNHDNYVISKGNSTQVFADGAVSYQWTPKIYVNDLLISNPFLNPVTDTRYTVTGINADGCSDTTSVLIRVIEGYSIMPNNVLTPNGDGFNDTWKIKNIEFYKENSITIYNSNSVKVFEKQNYTGDWNGTTTSGAKLASGAYYFVIKLKQGEVVVKGDLTILN